MILIEAKDTYQRFAKFYDRYVEGFSEDLPLYNYFCNPDDRILEIGCGTGRVLKSLAESGCNVTGIDISQEMLEIAQIKLNVFISSGQISLQNFNFLEGHLPQTFSRVLITFYTLNYLLDEESCSTFLQNIKKSMTPGGLLFIDLFFPRPMQKPEINDIWTKNEYTVNQELIIIEDKRRMINNIEEERIQKIKTPQWQEEVITHRRYYSKEAIFNILSTAGFKHIEFTNGYIYSNFYPFVQNEQTNSNFMVIAHN